jgi:hypothetical protein
MKALDHIPHISVEIRGPDFVRVTAKDGFALGLTRVDTRTGKFWKFDPHSTVSAVKHFHLRYLIDRALNA